MDVGIVVIAHNSAEVLASCLEAARAKAPDVLVIDNASTDDSAEVARRAGVRVEVNAVNRGFAAAANQGLHLTGSEFVLLLNPDTVLETPLDPLVRACAREGVGAAGGKLIGPDGSPQRGFTVRRFPTSAALIGEVLLINRLWPANPVNRRYRCLDLDLDRSQEVEQPAGAFLMIRREAWRRIGGFDESFFPVWFEDVDFCRRLRQAGWRIRYEPAAVARHVGGHSVRQMPAGLRQLAWYDSLLKYAGKHLRPFEVGLLSFAILVGVSVRMAVGMVAERSWRPLRSGMRVMRLAGGWPGRGRSDS